MLEKNDLYRTIGERIRVKRNANSLKQEKLAFMVNLTRSSIAQIEAGKQAPSIFLLYQLCNALKITIFDILPKDDFDPLSSEKILGNGQAKEILKIIDEAKRQGVEYDPSEH
jgi:transcriptional regulator with XRE-family HTH domain